MARKKVVLSKYVRALAGEVQLTEVDGITKQEMAWQFSLPAGTIRFFAVWFSKGCANNVQVQLAVNGAAIAPSDAPVGFDKGLSSDGERIPVSLSHTIEEGDIIEVRYLNSDQGSPHDFQFTLEIEVDFEPGGQVPSPLLTAPAQRKRPGTVPGFPQLPIPQGEPAAFSEAI